MYVSPGTYTLNLTVNNSIGTASKTATITVLENSSGSDNGSRNGESGTRSGSGSGKSSSKSSSSSGESGGGGGSPEPAKNIEVKELSQAFIKNGQEVKFDFAKNVTCVVYASFDAKKTLGKTTTVAEMLKGKSSLVSELPPGEVYKSFNIWVGSGRVASSKNIENSSVCFRVEKSWIQDEKINPDSIILNQCSDKKWEQLPVTLSGEDDKFLYFTARTLGFSSFAITGDVKSPSGENEPGVKFESETRKVSESDAENEGPESEQETSSKESVSTPGFGVIYGSVSLLAVFLYRRK